MSVYSSACLSVFNVSFPARADNTCSWKTCTLHIDSTVFTLGLCFKNRCIYDNWNIWEYPKANGISYQINAELFVAVLIFITHWHYIEITSKEYIVTNYENVYSSIYWLNMTSFTCYIRCCIISDFETLLVMDVIHVSFWCLIDSTDAYIFSFTYVNSSFVCHREKFEANACRRYPSHLGIQHLVHMQEEFTRLARGSLYN